MAELHDSRHEKEQPVVLTILSSVPAWGLAYSLVSMVFLKFS